MAMTLAELLVKVSGDNAGVRKALAEVRDDLGKTEEESTKMGKGMKAATAASAAALVGLAGAAKTAVGDASDLNESMSKSRQLFGEFAKDMPGMSSSVAKSLGMSRAAALDNAAGIGAMLIPMGKSKREAAEMSTRMLKLAADMGSFHNQDPTEMLDRIRAGLSGESEPLKRFGIVLTEGAVAAKAMSMGLVKMNVDSAKLDLTRARGIKLHAEAAQALRTHGKASDEYREAAAKAAIVDGQIEKLMQGKAPSLTEAQKLQARYALAIEQAGAANGDFERTSDGVANQQRILSGQVKDLSATMGTALLPAVSAVMRVMSDMIAFVQQHKTAFQVLGAAVAVAATAILTIAAYQKSAAAATAAWNMVLAANPIVLVVAALAALAVGLVIAYKRSETFRDIVHGAFSAVTGAGQVVAEFFTDTLPDAFKAALGWVRSNWPEIVTLLAGPFAPLVALATDGFGVRSALLGALRGLVSSAGNLAGGVSRSIRDGVTGVAWGFVDLMQDRITTPLVNAASSLLEGGKNLSRNLGNGLGAILWGFIGLLDTRIKEPLTDLVSGMRQRGIDLADGFVQGIKATAGAIWDGGVDSFKGFLNRIIRLINRIPFLPDIKEFARGGVVNRPTLGVFGEAGPEVIIPLSSGKKGRAAELIQAAAQMIGMEGNWAGIPQFADGGIFTGNGPNAYAAFALSAARAQQREGLWERVSGWARNQLGGLAEQLPTPGGAYPFKNAGDWIRGQAVQWIRGMEEGRDQLMLGMIPAARAWAESKMGNSYLWGGGHGGWDFGRKNFDCSGFASHAAKAGGSTLTSPGTTFTLLPQSHRTADGSLPAVFGFRGMESSDPRRQHMGIKLLGDWFQFGDPGRKGGTDAQWSTLAVPPGLPKLTGVARFGKETMVQAHPGEALLTSREAADWRAGRGSSGPPIQVTVTGNTMLADAPEVADRLARLLQPALGRLVTI